jgi:hypothetical protein
MPDLKQLGDFIQAIGFPAAVTVFLLYQMFAMDKANRKRLDQQNSLLEAIAQKLGISISLK